MADNEIRLSAEQLADPRLVEVAREFARRAGLKIVALPAGAGAQGSPGDLVLSRALAGGSVTYTLAPRLAAVRGGRLAGEGPGWGGVPRSRLPALGAGG